MTWHGVGVCVVVHVAGVVYKAATWHVAFIPSLCTFCVTVLLSPPPPFAGAKRFFLPSYVTQISEQLLAEWSSSSVLRQCASVFCSVYVVLWCACRAGLFISWVFPEIFSPSWVFPLVFFLGGVGLTLLNLSLGPQLMLAFFLLCDVSGV